MVSVVFASKTVLLSARSWSPGAKVEAEMVPELSARYKIEVVPSFVFLGAGGTVTEKVNAHARC